jgi:alkaline phosphatase
MIEGGEIDLAAHAKDETARAEKFGGIYDNTALFQKFLTSYGFEELK